MTRKTKTATNSEPMENRAKSPISTADHADDSESSRDLDRREEARRQAEAALRQMLEEAEASGISASSVNEIWTEAEAAYL